MRLREKKLSGVLLNLLLLASPVVHSVDENVLGIELSELRSFDGRGNHPDDVGMAGGDVFDNGPQTSPTMASCLMRHLDHYLPDGETPDVSALPHPRLVSNNIFAQNESIPNPRNLSQMAFIWGQFLGHDITETPLTSDASFPIPAFDDDMTKDGLRFYRSKEIPRHDEADRRQQFNQITSFIDASHIYGSGVARAHWLRTYTNGELKTSAGNLLPYGDDDGSSPPMAGVVENPHLSASDLFVAGDDRANENLYLNAMHTIFVREHNRLAREIRERSGEVDDEKIYEATRKILGAVIQSITYNEFLPALGVELPAYRGYSEDVDPRILNIFATAVYRLGHTMLPNSVSLTDAQGSESEIDLYKIFFAPGSMNGEFLDGLIRGAISHPAERVDNKVVNGIRNFMFDPFSNHGKLDLAMLNIHRAREHGLPRYMDVRALFDGDSKIAQVDEAQLLSVYQSLDHVDLWVGMLSEQELPGKAIGQTINDVFTMQFKSLRDGDRFFYRRDSDFYENGGLGRLGYNSAYVEQRTLAKIIADNTNVSREDMPENVFFVGNKR